MWGYGGVSMNAGNTFERALGGKTWNHPHGAPYGISLKLPWLQRYPSPLRTNRKRLNAVAIMLCVAVPWLLFCLVFALFSFRTHYTDPVTCWCLAALLLFVFVGASACLLKRSQTHLSDDEEYEPMWYGFLGITCLIAIIAGIILGFHNFELRMEKVYDYENLATYRDVDPANYVGQQLVDAGRLVFNNKTYLDVGRSMGFKDSDIYCVAPIASTSTAAKADQTIAPKVDFWAVGKNCCSGTSADFHCEGYKSGVRGGLRLMDDASRPYYRLAVQQAEATYGIHTNKPLFFVWGTDPIKYTDDLKRMGTSMYTTGIVAAFCVQCFFVVSATLAFAKTFPNRGDPRLSEWNPQYM